MLEILYFIFIFPVQGLLSWVLSTFVSLTQSYGLSFILLSLSVQVILLKLTSYFEFKAQAFNTLKASVNAKREEFKKVFRGAELLSYTRVLYKQKHFHPIFALFTLGGLALQIPIFIALIVLVNETEALKGVGFLWIEDLKEADRLNLPVLGASFSLHLLPLLMCALSLINVLYQSKDRGGRIQGVSISLIFLVLLYDMPSALVLYWSSNMLFSLLKAIWIKYKLSLLFMKDKATQTQELRTQGELNKLTESRENSSKTGHPSSLWQRIYAYVRYALFSRILTPHHQLTPQAYRSYRLISMLALVNICFMICVFSPFAVYSSDVSQFDPNQTYQTLGALFGVFVLSSVLLVYFTSFFYKSRWLKLGAYSVSVILLIGMVYTFVLTGDYGVMDHFVLQKLNFANAELRSKKIIQAFLTLSGSAIFVLLAFRYLKMLFSVSLMTLVVLATLSSYQISQDRKLYLLPTSDFLSDAGKNGEGANLAQNLDVGQGRQPYEKELFSYSKTKKNIVIIVLDMFSGSHMKAILDQFPEFRSNLDGFVWFDNTLSTASSTIPTIASIIGGEYYTTYNMNERGDNLADSITRAFGTIGDTFIKNDYSVSYFMSVGAKSPLDIQAYNKGIFVTQNRGLYNNLYLKDKDNLLQKKEEFMQKSGGTILSLLSVGLFRFVPELHFRGKVYNDALWLLKEEDLEVWMHTLNQTSSLYAFSKLHNTESIQPTFKYLHSMATHSAFSTYYNGGKCSYFMPQTAWNEYPHKETMFYPRGEVDKKEMFQHYDAEVCALQYLNDLIGWFKSEEIYDNTQLFIISDHGGNDFIGLPTFLGADDHRPDALFLFKDFNSRGNLRGDSRLMVNYDISSIFCENLPGGCPNVPPNILKNYPKNRSVISTAPSSSALIHHEPNQWILNHIYSVKDSIYDEANWQDITQEVKDGRIKFNGKNH